jgi:hypothetical protein
VLKASGPRPDITRPVGEKNKYAVQFANNMAKRIAEDLAPKLSGVTASPKRTARSLRGLKQLDVNFSNPQQGLALGVSLKSVHLRDPKSNRYTHNMKRNEEELRIEASGYHKRQPYAVMIGVLFLPFDSCDDAKKDPSSFGSWVRHLRPYSGRSDPEDEIDRFEKLYVALYEPNGSDIRFFDIEKDPPKRGRPSVKTSIDYPQFLDDIYHAYLRRNKAEFRWAEGEEAPIQADEEEEE